MMVKTAWFPTWPGEIIPQCILLSTLLTRAVSRRIYRVFISVGTGRGRGIYSYGIPSFLFVWVYLFTPLPAHRPRPHLKT